MNKKSRSLLSMLLALCLILSGLPGLSAAAAGGRSAQQGDDAAITLEMEDLDPASLGVKKLGEIEEDSDANSDLDADSDADSDVDADLSGLIPDTSLNSLVRVSIFFKDASAVDAGYAAEGIGNNRKAENYRAALRSQQDKMQAKIESAIGYSLDVKWHLTLLTNAISTYVKVKDIPAIKKLNGVTAVERENQYEAETGAETGSKADPNTSLTSTYMTGASSAWAAGYTGAGSRIAIIDTGIDTTHQSFNSSAFDYAISQVRAGGTSVSLMTSSSIPSSGLNGKGTYLSSKIPYAYNYVDENTTVNHLNDTEGEHGSHVAGIAAANRYIKNGNSYNDAADSVFAVGMAPDAQLLVMKVFGAAGGAYDSDYMAAIEDAIVLDADAVNLSLGSSVPGFTYANSYQEIMNKLADGSINEGMVTSISAGNNGSLADNLGRNLYIDDVYMHTGGSPGSYLNSLGVASADNIGNTGMPLYFNGSQKVFYNEPTGYSNAQMSTIAGSYSYVYIDALGTASDYSTINSAVSLSGKVVIVNRGELNFTEKGDNASSYSPKAVIIANNSAGTLGMDLSDMTYTGPMVSITLADALTIKANSAKKTSGGIDYYTGTVQVTNVMETGVSIDRADAVVSDFSSWGVPGSLVMKPEITAPGGDIYSVWGTNKTSSGTSGGSDQYELMSGTSMAAPHIAGLAAVAAQYLKATGYAAKNSELSASYSLRAIIQSLLMSTATPMKNDGEYVSILQQGSGLADVNKAIEASSVVMIDDAALTSKTGAAADGKVKAELGDDPDRTGDYSYAFTIYNMADQDLVFDLSTDLFTQAAGQDEDLDDGLTYMMPTTTAITANVTYSFDGADVFAADVNQDGQTDGQDAQAILDYLTGERAGGHLDLDAADLDQNGKITTYDAHLLLTAIEGESGSGQGQTSVQGQASGQGLVVPAGGSKQVQVHISIPASQKEILGRIYTSGAYVEGFTSVVCQDSDTEGVSYAHTHTIPLLGFYGSWTDSNMFDNTSYTDDLYFAGTKNYSGAEKTNYLTISYSGTTNTFTGNPYMIEDRFPADRLAVNSNTDTFGNIYYNLIRSAGTTGFAASKIDAIGGNVEEVLTSSVAGNEVDGLWYYSNQRTWQNTGTKSYHVGKSAGDYGLTEGDKLRLGFYAIPEYNGMLYHADNMTDASAGTLNNAGLEAVLKSNVLGKGAFVGYDFTIDNTDPVISSATLNGNSLTISASDNMNLAYLAVLSLDGNTVYEQTAPAEASSKITIDASSAIANASGYVAVFAADYAGNEAAVAVKVNNNTSSDPYAVSSVSLNPTSLDLYKGNEADIVAKVLPLTASDRSVKFTSSNTSVATVDASGHVMAEGAGTATITVASNANSSIKATCSVKVTSVNKSLNGIVWDEEGSVYFSGFNTSSLPTWTKTSNTAASKELSTALMYNSSSLYAGTVDANAAETILYSVNRSSYALTEYGTNYVVAFDMAPGASSSTYMNYIGFVYCFATYIIAGPIAPGDDGEGGTYSGLPYALLDCSQTTGDAYFVGMACKSRASSGGTYYLLDENGIIWQTTLSYSSKEGFVFSTPTKVMETGIGTSFLHQNLYYDGTYLYWSHYADNVSTLYVINPSTKAIYNAGNFGDSVWPVTGMYVNGSVAPAATGDTEAVGDPDASGEEALEGNIKPLKISREELMTKEIRNRIAAEGQKMNGKKNAAGAGSLNKVSGSLNAAKSSAGSVNSMTGKMLHALIPAVTEVSGNTNIAIAEDQAATNGFVTLSYDPASVTYVTGSSALAYKSMHADPAAGTITFAYASADAIPAGTQLATAQFKPGTKASVVTLNVKERGSSANLDENSQITIAGTGVDYPILKKVENTTTGVKISWEAYEGAEKYRVFYRVAGGKWTKIGETTDTSYTWTGAQSGTRYIFTVRCINASNTAYTSSFDSAGKTITYIAAPVVTKAENTTTGVKVTWEAVNGAASYRLFYKVTGGKWTRITDTTDTSYTWTGAASGTKYTFVVRATNAAGTSYTSALNTAGKTILYIEAPKVTSVSNTASGIRVAWSQSAGAAKYRLFYRVNEGKWTRIADTANTSYTWNGAVSGTTYRFVVRAVNEAGTAYTSALDSDGMTIIAR